jgi:hypothetical protein
MFIYINVYTVIIIVLLLIGYIHSKSKIFIRIYSKLRGMFIYNSMLRLMIEGYLELTISSFINLYDLSYYSIALKYQLIFTIIILILIIILPVFAIIIKIS